MRNPNLFFIIFYLSFRRKYKKYQWNYLEKTVLKCYYRNSVLKVRKYCSTAISPKTSQAIWRFHKTILTTSSWNKCFEPLSLKAPLIFIISSELLTLTPNLFKCQESAQITSSMSSACPQLRFIFITLYVTHVLLIFTSAFVQVPVANCCKNFRNWKKRLIRKSEIKQKPPIFSKAHLLVLADECPPGFPAELKWEDLSTHHLVCHFITRFTHLLINVWLVHCCSARQQKEREVYLNKRKKKVRDPKCHGFDFNDKCWSAWSDCKNHGKINVED